MKRCIDDVLELRELELDIYVYPNANSAKVLLFRFCSMTPLTLVSSIIIRFSPMVKSFLMLLDLLLLD